MQQFLGEFECRMDDRSRVRMPSALLRQLGEATKSGFVVNRGFEQCLAIYPMEEWQRITKDLSTLNHYVKKNRDFVRYFLRGATELQVDSNDRILLPKPLLEYIGADKDLILFAYFNKIEVWAKEKYDALLNEEPTDFADLAEEVMGGTEAGERA